METFHASINYNFNNRTTNYKKYRQVLKIGCRNISLKTNTLDNKLKIKLLIRVFLVSTKGDVNVMQ